MWGVLRTIHAGIVKTSVRPGDFAVLAVGVVKVGHSPAVLLILVVVGVGGAVLGGGDALGVGGGLAVVEVHLGASHVSDAGRELLARPLPVAGVSDEDHPDEKDKDDNKENSSGDTASNVGKVGLLGTVETGEGALACAVWRSFLVDQTASSIPAEAVTLTLAAQTSLVAVTLISKLALALVVICLLQKQTPRVPVASPLAVILGLAGVGALGLVGRPHRDGAGVVRAPDAARLLAVGLEGSNWTGLTLVVISIQILSRNADWKVAILNGLRGGPVGGPVSGTRLASPVTSLHPVGPHGALLALPGEPQLEAVLAVLATLGLGGRPLGPRGQPHAAQLTPELALLGLVVAEAAGSAQVGRLVVEVARGALLLTVRALGGAEVLGDPLQVLDGRALDARSLGKVRVVESDGTFRANLFCFIKVGSWGAGHALVVHHHLATLALECRVEDDGAGVKQGSGQCVVDSLNNDAVR